MAADPDGALTPVRVVIFENDPRQAIGYRDLFKDAGFDAQTALPDENLAELCARVQPQAALVDMGIWEADAAYIFGVIEAAIGFERPVILALASLPHQVRRAKKFGADAVWVRGVDDAAALPQLISDLLEQRRDGKLKPRTPATPL
jgi:AmiR/NasT family two-component response regulator